MKRFLSLFSRARSNISCKFHPTRLLVLFLLYSSMIAEGFTSATLTDALNSPISDQTNSTEGNDDPWEEFNRGVFGFNQVVDEYVLGPLAEVYQALLPTSTQECIHNFLSNLSSPLVLINDVAQFEGDRAMDTLARFLVNTTLGLGGLFDPAQEVLGINYHYEDFGLTLGTYGVENSPLFGVAFPRAFQYSRHIGTGCRFCDRSRPLCSPPSQIFKLYSLWCGYY